MNNPFFQLFELIMKENILAYIIPYIGIHSLMEKYTGVAFFLTYIFIHNMENIMAKHIHNKYLLPDDKATSIIFNKWNHNKYIIYKKIFSKG